MLVALALQMGHSAVEGSIWIVSLNLVLCDSVNASKPKIVMTVQGLICIPQQQPYDADIRKNSDKPKQ
jgi:hypothetical protein